MFLTCIFSFIWLLKLPDKSIMDLATGPLEPDLDDLDLDLDRLMFCDLKLLMLLALFNFSLDYLILDCELMLLMDLIDLDKLWLLMPLFTLITDLFT